MHRRGQAFLGAWSEGAEISYLRFPSVFNRSSGLSLAANAYKPFICNQLAQLEIKEGCRSMITSLRLLYPSAGLEEFRRRISARGCVALTKAVFESEPPSVVIRANDLNHLEKCNTGR
jgi:hypothetical protein